MAKSNLYPKTIYVENVGTADVPDYLINNRVEYSIADDEDEVVVAVYEFKKLVVVRREEKITITDHKK